MLPISAQKLTEYLRRWHGPAWRWALAGLEAQRRGAVPEMVCDRLTADAAEYRRLAARDAAGRALAARRFPAVHAAIALWNDEKARSVLRILTLGRSHASETTRRLQVDQQTVGAAVGLFFDLSQHFDKPSWIVRTVIQPEMHGERYALAEQMRLAYFGGPEIAQAVLDAVAGMPTAECDRLFDDTTLLALKFREAMAIPLNRAQDALKYIKLYYWHAIQTKRLDLAMARLRERCERKLARRKAADKPPAVGDGDEPHHSVLPTQPESNRAGAA